ncbi:tetratricopeptide repeat protein [Salibacterium sp. K-3]
MKTQPSQGQIIPFIQNSDYFFKRGVHAYQKQELKRAVKYVRRAVELNPDQGVFQCQLAAIYSDMGEYTASNDLLWHVLENVDETLYECYFFMANNYAYQGLFDKAGETVGQYLVLAPEGDFADDAKELLEMLDMETEEESDTSSGGSKEDDELIITYERALRMIEENRLFEAENTLEDIIAAYPYYPAAQTELARVLYLKGQVEEALVYAKEVWQEHYFVPAGCRLALLYQEAGRSREAAAMAGMLKQIIPVDRDHLYRTAVTLTMLEEGEDAFLLFCRFRKRFVPEKADFFFYDGAAAYQAGRLREAEKRWAAASTRHHTGADVLLEKMQHHLLFSSDVSREIWKPHSL